MIAENELPAALGDGHGSVEKHKSVLVPCGRVECGFLLGKPSEPELVLALAAFVAVVECWESCVRLSSECWGWGPVGFGHGLCSHQRELNTKHPHLL